MGPTHQVPDQDFEAQVRAMLLRRAADVQPRRPPWETLSAGSQGRVIPLTRGPDGRLRSRWGHGWVRPAVAAASVLALVLVGTIVIDRAGREDGSDGDESASRRTEASDEGSDVPRIAAPGNYDFVPAQATPIFPQTDLTAAQNWFQNDATEEDLLLYEDPNLVAEEYLASRGIPLESGSGLQRQISAARDIQDVTEVELLADDAGVFWSFSDGERRVVRGTVSLRRNFVWSDPETARQPWIVVGAMTHDLRLKEVRRDGDQLSFVVNRTADTSGIDTVRVEVNDQVLDEGNMGVDEPQPYTYTVPAEARDDVVIIRLQHLDPEPVSVTEVAVPVEYMDAGDELDSDEVDANVLDELEAREEEVDGGGQSPAP